MTSDSRIRKTMIEAGIPLSMLKHTLSELGYTTLREAVTNQSFTEDDEDLGFSGLHIYPRNTKQYVKARIAFYTLAKECVLTGYGTRVEELPYLLDALGSEGAMGLLDKYAYSPIDLLFIPDFYEDTLTPFGDGRLGNAFRAFLRGLIDAGVGVFILTSHSGVSNWYPDSFMSVLHARSYPYEIGE